MEVANNTQRKMKIKSKYRLGVMKNGKPFCGEVILEIESSLDIVEHQIIEQYQGEGFLSQGGIEKIPEEGYDSWKQGVKRGIIYGIKKIIDARKLKVTILECSGLTTDTNPIILAFVASRAILKELENKELESELNRLEELVFSSWNFKFDSQLDFDNFAITEN